jgi:hypothetical protein
VRRSGVKHDQDQQRGRNRERQIVEMQAAQSEQPAQTSPAGLT